MLWQAIDIETNHASHKVAWSHDNGDDPYYVIDKNDFCGMSEGEMLRMLKLKAFW